MKAGMLFLSSPLAILSLHCSRKSWAGLSTADLGISCSGPRPGLPTFASLCSQCGEAGSMRNPVQPARAEGTGAKVPGTGRGDQRETSSSHARQKSYAGRTKGYNWENSV